MLLSASHTDATIRIAPLRLKLAFAVICGLAISGGGHLVNGQTVSDSTNNQGPKPIRYHGTATQVDVLPVVTGNSAPKRKTTESPIDSKRVGQLLTRIVLDNMPHQYTDEKNWGQTERRWDGIRWRREGLKLETERRWKDVQHGTWKRYTAELVDPENEFSVQLLNLRNLPDGKTAFDLNFAARLKFHARQTKWVKGVQLYSVSADGWGRVRLHLKCESHIELGMTNFPPDIIFKPRVSQAQLHVDEFRLDRISKVGGEISQQVTREARKILDQKIVSKQEKIVQKINRQLEKNQDHLKISIHDALNSSWLKRSESFLPDDVRSAISSDKR